jgi:hypothetical protein
MDKITSPAPKKNEISGQGAGLDTVSIIRQDAIKEGINPDALIYSLSQFIKDPHYQLVKFDKTVFLLHLTKPFTVDVSLFSSDSIMGIMSSMKKMIAMAKQEGIKKAYAYTDQPVFKQAVERSKLPIKISQTTQQMGNQVKPVYQFEMDL